MQSKKIYLRRYDWRVTVFVRPDEDEIKLILRRMAKLNASDEELEGAESVLLKNEANYGLTYSSFIKRESVMVIGNADSVSEYFNTVFHESFHLSKHIVQCDGVDPFSETAAYIAGDFAQKVYQLYGDNLCLCIGDRE